MYYEVYVDVLFVENLWVNVCLLLLTSRLMGYQTDRKRIAAGAALGSMGACLLETGSAYLTTAGWFLGTILTAAVMIRTAYGKRNTSDPIESRTQIQKYVSGSERRNPLYRRFRDPSTALESGGGVGSDTQSFNRTGTAGKSHADRT